MYYFFFLLCLDFSRIRDELLRDVKSFEFSFFYTLSLFIQFKCLGNVFFIKNSSVLGETLVECGIRISVFG